MRWSVLCALAGCSFHAHAVGGDALRADVATSDTAVDDAPGDGSAAPRNCLPQWMNHTVDFNAPVALAELNTTDYERDPFVSPDELTIYFSSIRTGSLPAGFTDVFVATRTSPTATFGVPVRYAPASSIDGSDTKVSFTSDGNYLVVGSDRSGGHGAVDVWEATGSGGLFAQAEENHVGALEDSSNQQDPTINKDGTRIYLAPDTTGTQQIVTASRPDRSHNFGSPQTINELVDQGGQGTADPTLSVDELVIVVSSGRTGALGGGDLWYATRATLSDTFSAPIQVPGVNTTANEGDAHLSADGCHLYFASDRDSGQNWDLFVAEAR